MSNPADDELKKAFLKIARRQRSLRIDKLLKEVDRLNDLEDVALIQSEPIEFYPDRDLEFGHAVHTAKQLMPTLDMATVEYVSFRKDVTNTNNLIVYVVFKRGNPQVSGREISVSEAQLINAWLRAM